MVFYEKVKNYTLAPGGLRVATDARFLAFPRGETTNVHFTEIPGAALVV